MRKSFLVFPQLCETQIVSRKTIVYRHDQMQNARRVTRRGFTVFKRIVSPALLEMREEKYKLNRIFISNSRRERENSNSKFYYSNNLTYLSQRYGIYKPSFYLKKIIKAIKTFVKQHGAYFSFFIA